MNKKILLVQPNYAEARKSGAWMLNPPIGLCYIASVLEENGFKPKIFDANLKNLSPEQTLEYAKDYNIIGVSILSPAQKWSTDFINLLPDNVLKVCGGPHPTALPDDILRQGFDIVVRAEGEYTFLEIVQGKSLEKIKGISYKKNEKIFHNPSREPLDPNKIPFPSRHLLESNGVDKPYISAGTQYTPWACIFTSRGCPFDCNFCCKKIFGYKFRARTPENVFKEIKFLVNEYGVKEIAIYDDNFNMDMKRAEKMLDLIIDSGLKIHIRTTNGIRVNGVTKEFMVKMKKAGCDYVAFGFESGNQEVLNKIPKSITLDMSRNAVKCAKEAKIQIISGFFMFGLFGDTIYSMRQTIDFAKELDVDVALFNMATPYPGTRMYEMIKKDGKFLFDTNSWENIQHTSGKFMFTHPDVPNPEVVEEFYAKAHKEFYMRPKYIIKRAISIRNWRQFKMMTNAGIAFLKAIFHTQSGKDRKEVN